MDNLNVLAGDDQWLVTKTIFASPGPDIIPTVRDAASAWFIWKYKMGLPSNGSHQMADDIILDVEQRNETLLVQLREDQRWNTWRTTIAATPRVVVVTLENQSASAKRPSFLRFGQPRIVQELIRSIEPMDGPVRLTESMVRVTKENLHDVRDIIQSTQRHRPVVVQVTLENPDNVWKQRSQKIASQMMGHASLFSIDSTDILGAFNRIVGPYHEVQHGSVRTYVPGAQLHNMRDGERHRILGQQAMKDPDSNAWISPIRKIHDEANSEPIPEELRDLSFSWNK